MQYGDCKFKLLDGFKYPASNFISLKIAKCVTAHPWRDDMVRLLLADITGLSTSLVCSHFAELGMDIHVEYHMVLKE